MVAGKEGESCAWQHLKQRVVDLHTPIGAHIAWALPLHLALFNFHPLLTAPFSHQTTPQQQDQNHQQSSLSPLTSPLILM